MYSTTDLQLFIRIADQGTLSQAARDLELSTATASAGLKRLEQKLGTRLFVRSTRSMRLTRDGEVFLEYSRQALALLGEGEALIRSDKQTIGGHIRISASSDLGRHVLLPFIDAFQQLHPAVTVSLQLSDSVIDLFREPIDLAFRYGKLEDSSLVSQQLIGNRRMLVASPAYLAQHPPLQTPKDLIHHNCLLYYLKGGLYNSWPFDNGKEALEVKVKGDRMANDGAVVREWAVAGLGIAYKCWLDVRQDLEAGRLVRVLPQYQGDSVPLNAVYPHRNNVAPRICSLLAYLKAGLAGFGQAAQ